MQFKKEQKITKEKDFHERSINVERSWENLVEMYKIMRGMEITVHSE